MDRMLRLTIEDQWLPPGVASIQAACEGDAAVIYLQAKNDTIRGAFPCEERPEFVHTVADWLVYVVHSHGGKELSLEDWSRSTAGKIADHCLHLLRRS